MNKNVPAKPLKYESFHRGISTHLRGYLSALKQAIITSVNGRVLKPFVLAFSSCNPGEGVTTIATNFAYTFAEASEHRLLLVDCNLSRPSLHKVFQGDRSPGLVECITSESDLPWSIKHLTQGLDVLFAGGIVDDPWQMFGSRDFVRFLLEAKKNYNVTVLDCPPVVGVGETTILTSKADATVLVIESEKTRYEVAQRVQKMITNSGGNILGVVLNKKRYHIPELLYKKI